MIIHRYLFAHYRQVTVFFWPILFLELWRIDRWSAATGRQAFVQVDRYGRAWVPLFEEIGRASCRGKSVDLGGRRIIKKKKIKTNKQNQSNTCLFLLHRCI